MKKILITISIFSLLAGCSLLKNNAEEKLNSQINEFNKTHSGDGLPYEYEGPNTNKSTFSLTSER